MPYQEARRIILSVPSASIGGNKNNLYIFAIFLANGGGESTLLAYGDATMSPYVNKTSPSDSAPTHLTPSSNGCRGQGARTAEPYSRARIPIV